MLAKADDAAPRTFDPRIGVFHPTNPSDQERFMMLAKIRIFGVVAVSIPNANKVLAALGAAYVNLPRLGTAVRYHRLNVAAGEDHDCIFHRY